MSEALIVTAPLPPPPVPPMTPATLIDFPVPLPSGAVAYYRLPSKISEIDFNFYKAILDALKAGLVQKSRFPAKGTWKNKDNDQDVTIIGTGCLSFYNRWQNPEGAET